MTATTEDILYIETLIEAGFDPADEPVEGVPTWVATHGYDGVRLTEDDQLLLAAYREDTLTLTRQTRNGVVYAAQRFDAPDTYLSRLTAKAFTAVVEAWI